MSCDRHWKLLLGGFRSLVRGLGISKVKSNLCAPPILSFTPSFCWENIVLFVLFLDTHTHTHTHTHPHTHTSPSSPVPFPSCAKWTVPCESQSVSMKPVSCSVAKWGNMSFPHSHGSQMIRQPLRKTRRANCLCLQATLCVIIGFISQKEEPGEWQAGVYIKRSHAADWKREGCHTVHT